MILLSACLKAEVSQKAKSDYVASWRGLRQFITLTTLSVSQVGNESRAIFFPAKTRLSQ